MKSNLYLFFLLIFTPTFAQIEFSLQLSDDNITYTVFAKPLASSNISTNTVTGTGQVTIVTPIDFKPINFKNLGGSWNSAALVKQPAEDQDHYYLSFGLQSDDPKLIYTPGEPIALFSFENESGCLGPVRLIDNQNDAFAIVPNSVSSNASNELGIIDLDIGLNRINYIGNYEPTHADCSESSSDLDVPFEFKIHLDENGIYSLILKSNVVLEAPSNLVSNAQFTLTVPTGGFELGDLTSHIGNWSVYSSIIGPEEATETDYFTFGLSGEMRLDFEIGKEITLFSFKNIGTCTGGMNIISNTDPFLLNSLFLNVSNFVTVSGFGLNGLSNVEGLYNTNSADCSKDVIDDFVVVNTATEISDNTNGTIEWEGGADAHKYRIQFRKKGVADWKESSIVHDPKIFSMHQKIRFLNTE